MDRDVEFNNPVMFVEDDPRAFNIRGDLLSALGIPNVGYETADEAIAGFNEQQFSGVVTDGLNGEWQRVADAASQQGIPTLVLSGEDAYVEAAKEQGLHGIVKGRRAQEMIDVVMGFGRPQDQNSGM